MALAWSPDTAGMWATLPILLGTYFLLRQVGIADNGVVPEPEPAPRSKLARRILALGVLTCLGTALASGLVGGFAPMVPPGGFS